MKFSILLIIFLVTSPVFGEVIYFQDLDIYIDPPQDWEFTEDLTPEHWTMADPSGEVILQFKSYPKSPAEETLLTVKSRLKASGEEMTFPWNGGPAALGSWSFNTSGGSESAWVLAIETRNATGVFLVYTPSQDAQSQSDMVLSALNSISRGDEGRRSPGVLSEFYRITGASDGELTQKVSFPWGVTDWSLDKSQIESMRMALDRESRLLQTYGNKPSALRAWERFYRQVFREFHDSLVPMAKAWAAQYQTQGKAADQLPGDILSWLQKLEYDRKGGISDLTTPWESFFEKKGDCDSKALIYLSILETLGFKSILMISTVYSHGIAGVDIKGPGARFSWGGKEYLVAELTAPVAIGQIAADMADPKNWIGIEVLPRP